MVGCIVNIYSIQIDGNKIQEKQLNYYKPIEFLKKEHSDYIEIIHNFDTVLTKLRDTNFLNQTEQLMMGKAIDYIKNKPPTQVKSLQQQITSLRRRINKIKKIGKMNYLLCRDRVNIMLSV